MHCEVFPNNPMSPPDAVGRARMRQWLSYFEEVPIPAVRVVSYNKYLAKRFKGMDDAKFRKLGDSHPVRKYFYRHMQKDAGFSEADTEEAEDKLHMAAQRVNDALEKHGGQWIMGEAISLVDAAYMPTVDRMRDCGYQQLIDSKPALKAWYERYSQRDAFKKTYYEDPPTRLSAQAAAAAAAAAK